MVCISLHVYLSVIYRIVINLEVRSRVAFLVKGEYAKMHVHPYWRKSDMRRVIDKRGSSLLGIKACLISPIREGDIRSTADSILIA